MQNDAAEYDKLARDEDVPGIDVVSDDPVSHQSFGNPTAEILMTNVGHDIYPGSGPL